jgi:hypothetical protein
MSRPTPLRRYIARPASVVIRTVGDDAVAWNRADNSKTLLSPAYAALLASIPTRWIPADEISEPVPGALKQLLDAGLLVSQPAGNR